MTDAVHFTLHGQHEKLACHLGIDIGITFSSVFSSKGKLSASDPRNRTKSKNWEIRKIKAKSSFNRRFMGKKT